MMRSAVAASRRAEKRAERAATVRRRELIAAMKHEQAMQQAALAQHQVALYENYIDTLTSLHRECWNTWNWHQVAAGPPPPAPVYIAHHEPSARLAQDAYRPDLAERMLNRETTIRQQLAAAVEYARQQDHALWQQAIDKYQQEHQRWVWFTNIARGVTAGDLAAYRAVIEHLSPFQELADLGSAVYISGDAPWYVRADLTVHDSELVPDEAYSLTPTGKLSTKPLPKAKYFEIYQDHVASAALRVGRELFALLPIDFVFVNVHAILLNSATGHREPRPILSVAFVRATMDTINYEAVDPSDALSLFVHKMKFKKTTGFEVVDLLDPSSFKPRNAKAMVPSK